jgi:hypothetical protein
MAINLLFFLLSNGGRDPKKKNRQERHQPLVSIKNSDEATLSLLGSRKIGDLAIFFLYNHYLRAMKRLFRF